MKAIFSGWENKLLGSRTWPCECQRARDARCVPGTPKHNLISAGTISQFQYGFADSSQLENLGIYLLKFRR